MQSGRPHEGGNHSPGSWLVCKPSSGVWIGLESEQEGRRACRTKFNGLAQRGGRGGRRLGGPGSGSGRGAWRCWDGRRIRAGESVHSGGIRMVWLVLHGAPPKALSFWRMEGAPSGRLPADLGTMRSIENL